MLNKIKLIATSLILILSTSALAQVSISPAVVGGELDMTNGQSISLNISNTSGSDQPVSLSVGTGFSISLNRCPAILQSRRTCNTRIEVRPSLLASGTTIESLMNGASSLVNLKYIKSGAAEISSMSMTPSSLSFGSLSRAGKSVPKDITITNTGNITLSPIIELTPRMALVVNRCSSVKAGKSCVISVSMNPTTDMANGVIAGQSVLIKKDAGDAGQSVSVSGSLNVVLACSGIQHQENGLCVANTRSCAITNGTGTQSWAGSWSTCALVSCNSGFLTVGQTCVAPPTYVFDNYISTTGTTHTVRDIHYSDFTDYISFTVPQRSTIEFIDMQIMNGGSTGTLALRITDQIVSTRTWEANLGPLLPSVVGNSDSVSISTFKNHITFPSTTNIPIENLSSVRFNFTGLTLNAGTYYVSLNKSGWGDSRLYFLLKTSGASPSVFTKWNGAVLQNIGVQFAMRVKGSPVP